MNGVMNFVAMILCQFLNWTLNVGIFVLAIVEFGFFFLRSFAGLKQLKDKVDDLMQEEKQGFLERIKPHSYKRTTKVIKEWDYEEFDALRVEYQKTDKYYDTFALVIQLFPLLGILGTVAGLFISINNGEDLNEGVRFALSSTVYGIIFAVIFKVLDIWLITRYVNSIDYGMERFEKNYQEYKENYTTGFGRDEKIKRGTDEKKEERKSGDKPDAAAGRAVRGAVRGDAPWRPKSDEGRGETDGSRRAAISDRDTAVGGDEGVRGLSGSAEPVRVGGREPESRIAEE